MLGEYAAREASQNRLLTLGVLSLLGILLVLHVDFGSARLVALVALTLPFALIGGVAAAFLSGGVLSLGSLVGFVTVLGIAARNGIMLVSHYRHLEDVEGMPFGPELVDARRRGAAGADPDDRAGDRAGAGADRGRRQPVGPGSRAPDGRGHPRRAVHVDRPEPVPAAGAYYSIRPANAETRPTSRPPTKGRHHVYKDSIPNYAHDDIQDAIDPSRFTHDPLWRDDAWRHVLLSSLKAPPRLPRLVSAEPEKANGPAPLSLERKTLAGRCSSRPGRRRTPRHTGVRAMLKELVVDVKLLPSRENLMWVGIGAGLALAVHPADDNVNRAFVGDADGGKDFFKPGRVLGSIGTLLGASTAVYAVGRIRDQPRVSHVGMDLIRAIAHLGRTNPDSQVHHPAGAARWQQPHVFPVRPCCRYLCLRDRARTPSRVATSRYPLMSLPLYVAISRLPANRHWLSDTVFGSAVGIIAGRTVTAPDRDKYPVALVPIPGGLAVSFTQTWPPTSPTFLSLPGNLGGLDRRKDAGCRRNLWMIPVHEALEFRVEEIRPELELLHLGKRLIARQTSVAGHAIDSGHDAGAMTATDAVHVDRLLRGVVDDFQKLRQLRRRRLVRVVIGIWTYSCRRLQPSPALQPRHRRWSS